VTRNTLLAIRRHTNRGISAQCPCAVFNRLQHFYCNFQQKRILGCLVEVHATLNQFWTQTQQDGRSLDGYKVLTAHLPTSHLLLTLPNISPRLLHFSPLNLLHVPLTAKVTSHKAFRFAAHKTLGYYYYYNINNNKVSQLCVLVEC